MVGYYNASKKRDKPSGTDGFAVRLGAEDNSVKLT